MENGTKTYQIKINGLTESIDLVKSLNDQLNALEGRIKALEGAKIATSSSSGGGGGSRTSELSDEDKLLKQIEATQSKINQADMADYKVLLDKKNELKELVKEQKSMTAEARLSEGAYDNTMLGMKQHLADIKATMQTVDLNDTDTFEKLTKDANELNSKLLEIEKSYGQFGRQVGNYEIAAEGFKKLPIEIGGVVQEFDSARQALKALKQEMQTLSTKQDMGIITDEETERLKSLIPTVKQLESSIADAGKPMDALMDNMQSFVALAQAGKGLAAFFGLEDTGIDETIKNLVALQNAMQGLQTIQKQLQTGEGLGKYFAKGNTAIDNFTKKLFGVKKTTTEVTTASKAQAAATSTVATASKGAATAEVAQTTATAGLTVGMKAATVAAKLLSTALKAIGIGILLEGISLAIEGVKSLVSWITSESEEEKKAAKAAKEHAEMVKVGAEAYANAAAKVKQYQLRIDAFNGTAKQEKKLVEELNNEFGNQIGNYRSLEEWKKALIEQAPAYLETLKNEAILTQLAAKYAEIYAQKLLMLENFKFLPKLNREAIAKYFDEQLSGVDQMMAELIEDNQTLYNTIANAGSGAVTTVKDTNNDILEAERDLNNLRIQNMKEGLRKVITQLEEERKQKLAKVEQSGIMVEERRLEIEKLYNRKIEEATQQHLEKVKKQYEDIWNQINSLVRQNLQEQANLTNRLADKERGRSIEKRGDLFKNVYSYGIQSKGSLTSETLKDLGIVSRGNPSNELDELGYKVADASKKFTEEVNKLVDLERRVDYLKNRIVAETARNKNTDELKNELNEAQKTYEDYYAEITKLYDDDKINLQKNLLYQESYSDKLVTIAHQRYAAMDAYWAQRIKVEKEQSKKEYDAQFAAEQNSYQQRIDALNAFQEEQTNKISKALKDGTISFDEAQKAEQTLVKEYINNLNTIENNWTAKQQDLLMERAAKEKAVESEKLQDILQYYRDYYTALNNLEERQPVLNDWGIVNWKETKKNTKELIESYKEIAESLNQERLYITSSDILSDEEKEAALREIDGFMADLGDRLDAAKKFNINMVGEFIASIQQYIQALGNAIQTVMEANNKYQDYLFDKQQEDLDKQNDILQKKLNEQEDILQKHKSAVDDIENELATARGDRRQHLIDQLNEEIAAQRRAQAEKEQIEKKEDALKKKQDELDKQRKKAEYNRNLQSILVSGAMTISNAFATQPFVPVGIAMGALATTLTAYQYAMAKKAKPYATGGVIEGKSHKDGGVPVLGGRVEVEGGEFITNRRTTSQNTPLLEYINSKKKRIDLADMVEFFNDKPRTTIKNIRSKFADGGALPSTIDVREQLRDVIVYQDSRPVVVSVVDVINKSNDVRRVQALAGL